MTSPKRKIQHGRQYDAYFPKAKAFDEIVLKDGGVEDTVSLCQKTILSTLDQTKKIAAVLQGSTRIETARNIYNFILAYIQYQYDYRNGDIDAIERVRTPARTWADRQIGADCEDYSVFISSILMNLGIPHSLRIAKYNNKPNWQHIYVIMPVGGSPHEQGRIVTIDPVYDQQFNFEVPYSAKKDFSMPVNSMQKAGLAGLPATGLPKGIPNTLCCSNPKMMNNAKGIDAMELMAISQNLSRRATGLSGTSDAEIIAYMRTRIANEGLNTIDKLRIKLGSGAKWALDNNQTTHPLWKYAEIIKAQGQSVANAALKADITAWSSQLFGTPAPASSNLTTTVNPGTTMQTQVPTIPINTPSGETVDSGFSKLLENKPLVYGVGAAAAVGLAYVLLK